jgi:NACalpha-BTF3-like transcription factor
MMEDMESDNAAKDKPVPGEPIKEASTTTNEEDAELVYDHTSFRREKVRRQYFCYYHEHRIIIERGPP